MDFSLPDIGVQAGCKNNLEYRGHQNTVNENLSSHNEVWTTIMSAKLGPRNNLRHRFHGFFSNLAIAALSSLQAFRESRQDTIHSANA